MLLVLCDIDDLGALSVARHARLQGIDCQVLTAQELSFAVRRSHRLDAEGIRTEITLADGRTIRDADLSAVLNRLPAAPAGAWRHASAAEREYATAELHAFTLSWLSALVCPVRNRPAPESLGGAVLHPVVALAAAGASGLSCPRVHLRATTQADPASSILTAAAAAAGTGARAVHVVAIDGEVVAPEVPAAVRAGVRRFAEAVGAGQALLGVDFVVAGDQWWFAGSSPFADLALSPAVADRLLEVLGCTPGCAPGLDQNLLRDVEFEAVAS